MLFLLSIFTLFTVVTNDCATLMMDRNYAFAQRSPLEGVSNTTDKINIEVNSVTFAPLSDPSINQLKILINYQTTNPVLVNIPMAGIMKVFLSDGSPLKTINFK